MQQDRANDTATQDVTSAGKPKRLLNMHNTVERPRQHCSTHSKSDALAGKDPAYVSPQASGNNESSLSSREAGNRTMSWLPFPAMNTDVSWTDLADSDEEEAPGQGPTGMTTTFPNDGGFSVSGPLIPSFSGEVPTPTGPTRAAGETHSHSDLSSVSVGYMESPTPVALIHDVADASQQVSQMRLGVGIGASQAQGDASNIYASNSELRRLQYGTRDTVPVVTVLEPKLEAVTPVNSDERVAKMVENAKKGFEAGHSPKAPREGMGGTYFLSSGSGRYVGIFKPCDEEPLAPNNPKGWNSRAMSDPGMKPSVRVGEAALREVAAFLLDHDGFAGVPPACLVAVSHQALNYAFQPPAPALHSSQAESSPRVFDQSLHASEGSLASDSPVSTPADSRLTAPAAPGSVKLGSLQAFAQHTCDANDIASSRFSADSIHRVGILDVRLLNLDRHAGNLLVAEAPRSTGASSGPQPLHKLIPIDHGFALPEALDDPYFEWQYWPQASVPFSPEVKAYVAALDGPADVAMLQERLPALRPECLRCLLITTTVLKRCVAANMTLSEIAAIFTRSKASEASDFEAICMDARADARDHVSLQQSACLGPFPFDEASGELSPQSSLAMSGLIGNAFPASGTVSCDTSPFKLLPHDCAPETPLDTPAESPCMLAGITPAAGITPVAVDTALPQTPSTPSWLCTAELGPYSPHSPTLVAPSSVCLTPPIFHGCGSDDPAAGIDTRRSEQGMGGYGFARSSHLSTGTNITSRTVWRSKRSGRNHSSNGPHLLSAVHPDKANYVFSGLSESQWAVFMGRVEDFVCEELAKGTWKAPECTGPVAGSCPEPMKNRKF